MIILRKVMKKTALIILIVAINSGCASHIPVIDTKGVNMTTYNQDIAECQQYAKQIDPVATAGGGAAIGAVFGALLGAAIGGRNMAGYGAKIGAVDGIAAGGAGGAGKQIQIINNCMSGRGYKVLG